MRNVGKLFRTVVLAAGVALGALVALLAPAVQALADTYDTHTLVSIVLTDEAQLKLLREHHVDVVGRRGDVYKALVTPAQLRLLLDRGLNVRPEYEEMQADRERWAENERAAAAAAAARAAADAAADAGANAAPRAAGDGASFAPAYYTASKFNLVNPAPGTLMEHLLAQYNAHRDIVRLYNLGASQDGAYDILAMKITRNPDVLEPEPKIRVYGNIHGDEKGGCMVASDVLDAILSGYTANPPDAIAKKLVDESELWFIPMGNPYGNAHSTRYNSRSVDLNRNFWGPAGSDQPPAWSEKETQAIRDLTEAATADHPRKRFTVSLSFHEGEVCFNSVYNYTGAAPEDEPIFWSSRVNGDVTLAPHGLAQAYKDGCTTPGFWYTNGYDWYQTLGDTNDWSYGAWTALDTTIELNAAKTPPASQIPTYCAQHRPAVLNYMMKAFQGIHGVMTDADTGLPLDGTVTATATASPTLPVPHEYKAVYTDPVAGDFHRVLQPGTYTILCEAPGYAPATVPGLVVAADARTTAGCALAPQALVSYASSTTADACAGGGAHGGDGVLDAGEDATLQVTLRNAGAANATSVVGTLGTTTPGIAITGDTASFPDVPAGGGSAASLPPHFRFTVGAGVACGTNIAFRLSTTTAQGSFEDTFTVPVGQTSVAAPVPLLGETFDGTTFPPAGWAQVDTSGTAGNWARATNTVHPGGGGTHGGAGLAYFNSYSAASGSQTRLYRLIGTPIPPDAAAAGVTFWMYHDTGYTAADAVQVQVSTNGATWADAGAAVLRYDGSTGWKPHTVPLDGYNGQTVQVALLGKSVYGNDCHVDDVQLTYTPFGSCTMNPCAPALPPGEVAAGGGGPESGLHWTGATTIAWPPLAGVTSYKLYRGVPADLPRLLDAGVDSCVRYAGSATSATDADLPGGGGGDAGAGFWYLVTGLNGPLEGPAGDATSGPRVVNGAGDCP